jgi:hypothetical protein
MQRARRTVALQQLVYKGHDMVGNLLTVHKPVLVVLRGAFVFIAHFAMDKQHREVNRIKVSYGRTKTCGHSNEALAAVWGVTTTINKDAPVASDMLKLNIQSPK